MQNLLDEFLHRTHIAYFSMEIALRPEMHTYSGGLGVLAGDTARSAADLALPLVFVTLISRAGHVRQQLTADGSQLTLANPWEPPEYSHPLQAMVAVTIEDREVWIRPWLYLLNSPLGTSVPILLLDTNLEQNDATDREITDHLYGGDETYRLKQEIVLGLGGALILQALGFRIRKYHLNEGHAALLTLYLMRQFREPAAEVREGDQRYEHAQVRERCVFTTHTPIEAAFDRFEYPLVERVLGDYIELDELKHVAGPRHLNMTRLALNLSGYVNGVSERHAETTNRIFPGYRVLAITNGVHAPTWVHPKLAHLYQSRFPHWAHEPEVLARADQLPDDDVWGAHQAAKRELISLIKREGGVVMREDVLIIGFARRMTEYKRPNLLFTDINRLTTIARERPFQVVLAGIAHPHDERGKHLIAELNHRVHELADIVPITFLANYDMRIAASVVAGVDVWLNTPLPPFEASGTSGMKAALNGGLNLSVLDGWWVEAHIEGVTGWAIGTRDVADSGRHTESLYRKLAEAVLPLYYDDRMRWVWMMKQAISKIGGYFNSHRMIRRYATEAYIG